MAEEHKLGFFERYLTVWVAICIVLGLVLGERFPGLTEAFEAFEIMGYPVIVAIALFLMIYPIMVQTDFREIIRAGKTVKPLATTLILNWAVKPFTMAFVAWLFFRIIFIDFVGYDLGSELMAGMILLGVAPCTAMVLVWGYLSRGNMGHVVVMVAINSLTMVVLYGPLAVLLLPIADVPVPIARVAFGVLAYVGCHWQRVIIPAKYSWNERVKRPLKGLQASFITYPRQPCCLQLWPLLRPSQGLCWPIQCWFCLS